MTKEAKFKTLRANELACTWGIRSMLFHLAKYDGGSLSNAWGCGLPGAHS